MSVSSQTLQTVSDALAYLTESKAPADLEPIDIFTDDAHDLFLAGPTVISSLTSAQVMFHPMKSTKRPQKTDMWSVDVGMSAPGFFDEAGNFVLHPSKQLAVRWFVRRDGACEGPFSEAEIRAKAKDGQLDGTEIKRDFDRGFVKANELLAAFPELNKQKEISKFFAEHQQVEEAKQADDDFYCDVIVKDKLPGRRSSRLTNFLQTNHISASVEYIVKSITGKRRNDALVILGRLTRMSRAENNTFLDLILDESDKQILLDVDKDGFALVENRRPGPTKNKRS